jgi:hypothetical protein
MNKEQINEAGINEAHRLESLNLNVFKEMIKELSDEDKKALVIDLDLKLNIVMEEYEK